MPSPRIKLGLFGGSFDPVHLGHRLVAESAREELGLDRLYFIPAAQSPFKPLSQPAPVEKRMCLLRLALAGCGWSEIDPQEALRGGISYTIDAARDYRSRFPDADLYYLVGADHVPHLPKWRAAEELAELLTFVVIPRPGQAEGHFPPPFRGRWLTGFPLSLSSSQIRGRVAADLPIDHLVGSAVAEAIRNYRLYLSDKLNES
jgi:nicotinate-nucleotide adenylyltransferase